jgi:hypothetical protein
MEAPVSAARPAASVFARLAVGAMVVLVLMAPFLFAGLGAA